MIEILLSSIHRFGRDVDFSSRLAALAGLLAHVLYFIHGWRNSEAVRFALLHLLALCLLFVKTVSSLGLPGGFAAYLTISSSYFATLFLSMILYRVFFHRLRRFPGPLLARISKLYGPWRATKGPFPDEYRMMHEKYGEFVRVGPNEISILNVDAFPKVHGPLSKCTKHNTGIYDATHFRGEPNLDTIARNDQHRDRRKVWDTSLSTKSLEKLEVTTRAVVQTFMGRLDELNGKPINTSLYSTLIAFDNMGRVGFSRDFGTVKDGREDKMLDFIQFSFRLMAKFGQLAWPAYFIFAVPPMGTRKEFEELGMNLVDERIAVDSEGMHDMMKFFLEDFHSEKPKTFTNINTLYSDSQAVLIGATDTIASALGFAFYFLASDKTLRGKIRTAIAPAYGKTTPSEFVAADLAEVELLDAFIKESMRMYNPIGLNGPRTTPPEGIVVDGTFIPGNIVVYTPLHVYNRSAKYWKQPDEFILERWTTRPDLIIDKRAYNPFHYGRYDCVGKRLAYNVIRLTIAYTLWNYDFEYAPGEEALNFGARRKFEVSQKPPPLWCVFTKR